MSLNVGKEVSALQRMTVKQLREHYAEVFGDETRTGNKAWLVKRIAWRLQVMAEGGLSERCPDCGMADADRLVWIDDEFPGAEKFVRCDACGTIYSPDA